jgi:GNAT superfamily N-acetyltransferase
MATQTNVPPSDGTSVAPADALAIPRDVAELDGPLVLRDGTVLHQRAIRADDALRLQAFHQRLSRQTVVFRFFGVMPVLSSELAERLSHVDYGDRMAVVATPGVGTDEPIIAVVRYQRTTPEVAEIALAVEDRWQGHGIGPRLLQTLATYACRWGFTTFVAEVMYDNDHMLALLRRSGFPTTFRLRDGRVEARLEISGVDARLLAAQNTTPSAEHTV